ncbi:PUB domain protein [Toxoplasma gondii MAS]|uniref:PUB domain protein n=1 Tax=Toxoplasma gondii MAS TaxID=943118 RepID=A0A086QZ38_TOXGO|nr:PUB domain protein [Toxoplasma gondii MAS]
MEEALREMAHSRLPKADQIQALNLLIKIVNNVLSPPGSANPEELERFRCINSGSTALQQRLLRHGPVYENLLLALGFYRTTEPPVSRPLPQPNQEYFFLPDHADRAQLLADLELLRATVASLETEGDDRMPAAERLTSGGSTGAPRKVTTTSRAIRDSSGAAHARNQEELRQLREEQRARFEQRSETQATGGITGWLSASLAPSASVSAAQPAQPRHPEPADVPTPGGSRREGSGGNAASRFFKSLFGGRSGSRSEEGHERGGANRRDRDSRGPRMKTIKDLPPAPQRRG